MLTIAILSLVLAPIAIDMGLEKMHAKAELPLKHR